MCTNMRETTFLYNIYPHFLMQIELIMDVKFGILILLNMALPQKLVLAPGAIIRGNTVSQMNTSSRTSVRSSEYNVT